MTADEGRIVRQAIDRAARAAQPAHDEIEELMAGPVFDAPARELMQTANLGLALAAHHQEETNGA